MAPVDGKLLRLLQRVSKLGGSFNALLIEPVMASTESPAGTKLAGVKLAGTTLAGVRPAGVELAGTKLGANPPSSIEGV
eukprot:CAMPEP_0179964410 /NCGR_PEP_ID=MMETSP0983-20121128/31297_1 /TAXON_ID=483367 /ORGANISM="non described non described, Strain CCMP 2436" /LENGTH=78 /DNA_ID=CAMNT_0021877101 /DNA_START=314 /DNA_END=551 /DNA_ORIENTATION=-